MAGIGMTKEPAARAIWDMDTVFKVRRLYVVGWLSEETLISAYDPDVIIRTQFERMFHQFAQEAHVYAVEVSQNQMRVDARKDLVRLSMHYRMHWEPGTREVELRGGQPDGELRVVENIWIPLNIPNWGSPVHQAWDTPEDAVIIKHLVYKIAGWSEADQHWIFDLERQP